MEASRAGLFPFGRTFGHVDPRVQSPVNAYLLQYALTILYTLIMPRGAVYQFYIAFTGYPHYVRINKNHVIFIKTHCILLLFKGILFPDRCWRIGFEEKRTTQCKTCRCSLWQVTFFSPNNPRLLTMNIQLVLLRFFVSPCTPCSLSTFQWTLHTILIGVSNNKETFLPY